jgi:predicted amidohydrolase YtcJ
MNPRRKTFLTLGLVLSGAHTYALPTTNQKDAAFVGATIYDGTDPAGRPNMVIVTRAGRIAAILPAQSYRAQNGTEAVSVRGKFVIPGLINSHVHLATLAKPAAAKAYLRR